MINFASNRNVIDLAFQASTAILVGSGGERIIGWDAATGEELFVRHGTLDLADAPLLVGQTLTRGDLADGATRAAVSIINHTDVFDVSPLGAAEVSSLATSESSIDSAAFSPDGLAIVTAGREVTLWEANSNTATASSSLPGIATRVSFDGSGRFVTVSGPGRSGVWNAVTGEQALEIPGSAVADFDVAFTPDGAAVARGNALGDIEVYDTSTGRPLLRIPTGQGVVRGIAVSPDGSMIASAGNDGTVKSFRLADGDLVEVLEGHAGPVFDVAFSSDGRLIASAGSDGTARLWDVAGGGEIAVLNHFGPVTAVAFSPRDDLVATIGAGGQINLWNTSGGRDVTLSAHTGTRASRLAFSADGSRIAGIAQDSVTVWDTASRTEVLNVTDHTASAHSGAFSPDADQLLAVGSDGVARVFALDIEELTAIARSRLTRTFTAEECATYAVHCETIGE